jgi:hypothetical protein
MNDQFEVFYEYLTKSQNIRHFCEEKERLLLETIRSNCFRDDEKIYFLNILGSEIDEVTTYINTLNKGYKKIHARTIPKDKPRKLTKEELKSLKQI